MRLRGGSMPSWALWGLLGLTLLAAQGTTLEIAKRESAARGVTDHAMRQCSFNGTIALRRYYSVLHRLYGGWLT